MITIAETMRRCTTTVRARSKPSPTARCCDEISGEKLPLVGVHRQPGSQAMSYLHCLQCSHAYNLAVTPVCPCCPVTATVVDAEEDILAAADALARAMARAT